MNIDVFISYSSKNKTVADAICAGLERENIRCWIAPRDVLPGKNYGEAIIQGLSECKVVVLVFSQDSNLSPAVLREMERAMHHARPIIPFRLDDIPMSQGLQFFLASCHWLDAMNPPLEAHIDRLRMAVQALLGQPVNHEAPSLTPAPPAAPATGRPPWNRLAILAAGLLLVVGLGGLAHWHWGPLARDGGGTGHQVQPAGLVLEPVSCDVTLAEVRGEVIRDHFRGVGPASVRYASRSEGDRLKIWPDCPYLAAWEGTAPLRALRPVDGRFFSDSRAHLDLKMLNTGTSTVFLQKVVAEVTSSRSQARPLLVLDVTETGQVRVVNVGAPTPDPVKVRLALAGPEEALDDAKLPPPVDVDLADGVAVVPLPARDPSVEQTAFGELVLGSRIRRFELAVGSGKGPPKHSPRALPQGRGPGAKPAPRSPTGGSSLTLRPTGDGYEAECGISLYLKPNEGDRLALTLAAAETSVHRFRLRLEYDDGSGGGVKSIRSQWLELELFQPRSGS